MSPLPKLPAGDVWPAMLQGSEQWLKARKGRATASQAKKIITPTGRLSAQSEAYARQLARECLIDDPLAFTGNKATDWGTDHEPEARDLFRKVSGLEVIEIGFVTQKANPILGASPDGIALDHAAPYGLAGLEIKCPTIDKLVEWMLDGSIPEEHLPQIHASMVVTGLKKWHFAAYFPGVPLFRPAPAVWNSFTDHVSDALDAFVIQYAPIRAKVHELLRKGVEA